MYKNNVCRSLPVYSSVQNMTIWPFICLNSYKGFEIFFLVTVLLEESKTKLARKQVYKLQRGSNCI